MIYLGALLLTFGVFVRAFSGHGASLVDVVGCGFVFASAAWGVVRAWVARRAARRYMRSVNPKRFKGE